MCSDSNTYHLICGSFEINDEGVLLMEFVPNFDLAVCNRDKEQTFVTVKWQEVLDITLFVS